MDTPFRLAGRDRSRTSCVCSAPSKWEATQQVWGAQVLGVNTAKAVCLAQERPRLAQRHPYGRALYTRARTKSSPCLRSVHTAVPGRQGVEAKTFAPAISKRGRLGIVQLRIAARSPRDISKNATPGNRFGRHLPGRFVRIIIRRAGDAAHRAAPAGAESTNAGFRKAESIVFDSPAKDSRGGHLRANSLKVLFGHRCDVVFRAVRFDGLDHHASYERGYLLHPFCRTRLPRYGASRLLAVLDCPRGQG